MENPNTTKKRFILNVCCVLLFCVFCAVLFIFLYWTFSHGALNLDSIYIVCDILLEHLFNLYCN